MTAYPVYAPSVSLTTQEWNWHRLGWIPAPRLDDWQDAGCWVKEYREVTAE